MRTPTFDRRFALVLVLVPVLAACGEPDRSTRPATRSGGSGSAPSVPAAAPPNPSSSPSTVEDETRSGPRILFLGDSLAAGLGVAAEEAFPQRLGERLEAAGIEARIVNAGVSGDTTAGGLARLDWLLRQRPDLVVVELGANDGLRGLPLAETESNLRQILDRLEAEGVPTLLLGMRIPPNYGPEYTEDFAAIYPRLADEKQVPLVPFLLEGVAGSPELNQADGIHPTAEGHRRIAEHLEPLFVELVRAL